MRKSCRLVWLFSLMTFQAFAQGTVEERRDLHDLLEMRRKKFDAYSNSLSRRTGFFGNKTKKDVQHSTDVLMEIVETDNRIISSLNHVIDFRNYEKVNTNYDKLESDQRLTNLQCATDTLVRQLDIMAISNAALKSKIRRTNWLLYGLSLVLVWMLVSRWKRKTVKQ